MPSILVLVVSGLVTALAVAIALPVFVFAAEVLAAMTMRRPRRDRRPQPDCSLAVMIPAHDEASGIDATVRSVRRQLRTQDRVLVIADNCRDDTARVAALAGADVVERNDPSRRGKGYALDFGLRTLAASPPAIVVIVDADCVLEDGCLARLARDAAASGRPIQGRYVMVPPDGAQSHHSVSALAWIIKNEVRPTGLSNLGLPCQLMGSGMAIPWAAITSVDMAHADVVEDLLLGLQFAERGHAPLFCSDAVVRSAFPVTDTSSDTQRRRWEHGHIRLIRQHALRLLVTAVRRKDTDLFVLALDLAVPPLALLAALLLTSLGLGAMTVAVGGHAAALAVPLAGSVVFTLAVAAAWHRFGRHALPVSSVAMAVPYAARKLVGYPAAIFGRRLLEWTRTERH